MSLATKYRPTSLDEVVGQKAVIKSIKEILKRKSLPKTWLFLGPSGCVDGETEYLTPTGWKPIASYKEGAVAQFNLDGTINFVNPTSFIKKPCDEFFHLKTKYGIDQMLSSEHRVLYKTTKGNWAVRPADEVVALHEKNNHGFYGSFVTTFTPITTSKMDLTDDQLRLMVAF